MRRVSTSEVELVECGAPATCHEPFISRQQYDQQPLPPPSASSSSLVMDVDAWPHARRPFVISGYRPPLGDNDSLMRAFLRGLFSVHNETLNIWSHLLGLAWALSRLSFMMQTSTDDEAIPGMRSATMLFHASAVFLLFSSVLAHLFSPIISREPSTLLWKLDSLGITVLIGGSYLPALTFWFRCGQPLAKLSYTAIVVALLSAGAYGSIYSSSFGDTAGANNRGNREGSESAAAAASSTFSERIRVCSLAGCVGFGVVPLLHFCMIAPADERVLALPPVLRTIALYGVGFTIYGTAIPESFRPGAFDYRGGSHLLWHLAVLAAVRCFDGGVEEMRLHRDEVQCQGW